MPRQQWPAQQNRYLSSLQIRQRNSYERMYDYQRGYLSGLKASHSSAYWRWPVQRQSMFWRLYQYEAYRSPFWNLSPAYQARVLGWAPNYWDMFFNLSSAHRNVVLAMNPRQSDMFWSWNNYDYWDFYFSLSPNHRNIILAMTPSAQRLFWALEYDNRMLVLGLSPAQRHNLFILPEAYFWQAIGWPEMWLSEPPSRARIEYVLSYYDEPPPRTAVSFSLIPRVSGGIDIAQAEEIEPWMEPVDEGPAPELVELREAVDNMNVSLENVNTSLENLNALNEELEEKNRQLAEQMADIEDENNALAARIKQLERERPNLIAQIDNEAKRAEEDLIRYRDSMRNSPEKETVLLEIEEARQELARLEQGLKVLS